MIIKYKDIEPVIHPSVFIAGSANIIGKVKIDEFSSLWFQTVTRGDVNFISIGKSTNIQDGAMLHVTTDKYPLIIGDYVTVGHGAMLHGCTIGDCCLIGMGAIVLDDVRIGDGCIIGAGSVVPEHSVIEPETLVLGIPAKPKRKISKKEIEEIKVSAINYVELAKKYKR
ncbi:MAG: gamma carbonic anhydrase family protein [Candidatus Schekmanbacteria bacterium RIFCSPHIGHO2_02_FULL_38_11]|uniref:Gamma carbonic anhydrase family protein n=1 Tax=Candidatus Schekmanbacteria bacterium RIFCSPLOWO2_12_FULL_38_15 TaxID=1817883 RepID=A0A1F7SF66_9BACT|nr:MAG: gamma carbonic anhydrase family protein [Candidatus Schekmanbacteria bacterium GWA2_38_9]OGL49590.1 MAG: gamma carbonic anhydrase family protein [Candidatus Schekmanbacteria bacterium RIFCSPHIGHO2_02_FULL_38_11]OGL49979.1 MAG: gamma carbonic anhydrase family protein [Candidatus Schekmanbacteria bacterium RIFCSPLOWO2_02_FULL_38_14]OGL51817.1 MAG: gamma carbonic anhydrase family protein [Candidatus Schekmanbacteria bacterium RIFCSPLOWO2_12_FULL_38_15]